jgi:hypothetical protein
VESQFFGQNSTGWSLDSRYRYQEKSTADSQQSSVSEKTQKEVWRLDFGEAPLGAFFVFGEKFAAETTEELQPTRTF